MDLQHIAAQLTEVDLQELLVRYVMNDAVRHLKAANKPITWANISKTETSRQVLIQLLTPSTLQPMFELVAGQYVKGGWKDQIRSDGKVVWLDGLEVLQVREDLDNVDIDDRETLKFEEDAHDRRNINDAMATRAQVVAKLA